MNAFQSLYAASGSISIGVSLFTQDVRNDSTLLKTSEWQFLGDILPFLLAKRSSRPESLMSRHNECKNACFADSLGPDAIIAMRPGQHQQIPAKGYAREPPSSSTSVDGQLATARLAELDVSSQGWLDREYRTSTVQRA